MDPTIALDAQAQAAEKSRLANRLVQEFSFEAKLIIDTFEELRLQSDPPTFATATRRQFLARAVDFIPNIDHVRRKLRAVDNVLAELQLDLSMMPVIAEVAGLTTDNAPSFPVPSGYNTESESQYQQRHVATDNRAAALPSSEMARVRIHDTANFANLPYVDCRDGFALIPLPQALADQHTAAMEARQFGPIQPPLPSTLVRVADPAISRVSSGAGRSRQFQTSTTVGSAKPTIQQQPPMRAPAPAYGNDTQALGFPATRQADDDYEYIQAREAAEGANSLPRPFLAATSSPRMWSSLGKSSRRSARTPAHDDQLESLLKDSTPLYPDAACRRVVGPLPAASHASQSSRANVTTIPGPTPWNEARGDDGRGPRQPRHTRWR